MLLFLLVHSVIRLFGFVGIFTFPVQRLVSGWVIIIDDVDVAASVGLCVDVTSSIRHATVCHRVIINGNV